jgi:hypothetical protein
MDQEGELIYCDYLSYFGSFEISWRFGMWTRIAGALDEMAVERGWERIE